MARRDLPPSVEVGIDVASFPLKPSHVHAENLDEFAVSARQIRCAPKAEIGHATDDRL
jgi:hypothetical protein